LNEITSLLKRADRYHASSELLIKDGDFESSVSRSYYAMFFSAQAALLSKNLSFSSHKMTISAFGENFVKKGIFSKEMGKNFNKAFDRRQMSDYYHDFIIDKKEAVEIFRNSKVFVETVKHFLNL